MKLLLANSLSSASLFPPREPGQFARNWFHRGSNGKGNHVEAPFAKPPPEVIWKVSQIAFTQAWWRLCALAQHGVARIAANDVSHAAANDLGVGQRGREAAVEDLRVCGH